MTFNQFWRVPARAGKRLFRIDLALVPLVLVAVVGGWELLVRWRGYPAFFLPGPARVGARFVSLLADGTLLMHTRMTLFEIFGGLALGLTVATVIGYGVAKSPLLERILSPYIVASQAIPIVALAPLLVVWFGFGWVSKVLVCSLTVFFPALVNTVVGIRSVEPDLRALMRSLQASRWQTFTMLEVPAALPVFFGGLKVAVTLAVIGAVVGEFVGADRGLGFLINLARGLLDTPMLFVALFTLVFIALALYSTVALVEYVVLRWRRAV
ncbi:MAG: ABC transporter permease [Chloroflexi bacterium]|nr:ABC transporter permease [Chloroflexota bacterium]